MVRKLTNTTMTLFQPPKGGLSLDLMIKGQTYSPKCKPKWLANKILRFRWDVHVHSTCNTAKFSGLLIFQICVFSLVMILTFITPSLYDFSQPDFHRVHASHIYICCTSHILWKNLQAYNIEGIVQQEKEHKKPRSMPSFTNCVTTK